jgi:DNA-binding response OmpR family regulator
VLNLALKTLKVDDIDIKLTKNEYSIIEMLALNQGRTITYSQIEQQTHDSATSISRNSIEVHVSALRKKLKSQNVSNLIKTQRSFGYYIE